MNWLEFFMLRMFVFSWRNHWSIMRGTMYDNKWGYFRFVWRYCIFWSLKLFVFLEQNSILKSANAMFTLEKPQTPSWMKKYYDVIICATYVMSYNICFQNFKNSRQILRTICFNLFHTFNIVNTIFYYLTSNNITW